jgi:hypothetical protein
LERCTDKWTIRAPSLEQNRQRLMNLETYAEGSWLSSLLVSFCGCDGNLNRRTLFESHVITVFVRQRIFNTGVSILVVSPANDNLCLFRFVWASTGRFRRRFRAWWYLDVLKFAQYLDSVPLFLRTWPCAASPFPS